MKLKLVLASLVLLLVPVWATAQEPVLPLVSVLDLPAASVLGSAEYFARARPLPGIRVSARIDPSRRGEVAVRDLRDHRATSDANGQFTFPDLAPGDYLLQFTQLSTIAGLSYHVPDDRCDGTVNITVTEGGIERRSADGQSECTLEVSLLERSFLDGNASFGLRLPHLELTLDAAGSGNVLRGTITKELIGTLVLTTRPAMRNVLQGTITSERLELKRSECGNLRAGRGTSETTGRDCTSRVTADSGVASGRSGQLSTSNPIPGVEIIVRKNPGDVILRTRTDADGAFVVANLTPGDYVLGFSHVTIPGTVPISVTETEITERGNVLGGETSEDQNPRNACVTGRVTNAQGQPETACRADDSLSDGSTGPEPSTRGHFRTRGRYSAATVRGLAVTARTNSSDLILQAKTDDEGEFAFRNLAPGEYVLEFAQTGLRVDAGAVSELRVVVSESGLAISDTESLPEGRIGAIAVDPSDPSGNTVFVGGANGGVWKSTDLLTIELTTEATERGNTLYGRISENESPQDQLRTIDPIPGIDVVVRKNGGIMFQATTDSGGAFSFANLAPGEYLLELAQPATIPGAEMKLVVHAANDAPRSREVSTITYTGLEVAWNPQVELKTHVTERGNILAGRVTNETTGKDCTGPPRSGVTLDAQQGNDQRRASEPIPGTHVIIARYSGIRFETTTDDDGAFAFPNLAPGEYVLQFAQPATIPGAQLDLTVTENRIAIGGGGVQTWNPHVELRMKATQPGNVLTGRVTFEFDNNSDVARTTGRNCESVSRPRQTR